MEASKTKQFSENEKLIANIGRALSNPARVRILEILYEMEWCKNVDLTTYLELSPSSVNNHLKKMKQAEIIKVGFFPIFYKGSLNHQGMKDLKDWTSNYQ